VLSFGAHIRSKRYNLAFLFPLSPSAPFFGHPKGTWVYGLHSFVIAVLFSRRLWYRLFSCRSFTPVARVTPRRLQILQVGNRCVRPAALKTPPSRSPWTVPWLSCFSFLYVHLTRLSLLIIARSVLILVPFSRMLFAASHHHGCRNSHGRLHLCRIIRVTIHEFKRYLRNSSGNTPLARKA
jgi:hypothetical protein